VVFENPKLDNFGPRILAIVLEADILLEPNRELHRKADAPKPAEAKELVISAVPILWGAFSSRTTTFQGSLSITWIRRWEMFAQLIGWTPLISSDVVFLHS